MQVLIKNTRGQYARTLPGVGVLTFADDRTKANVYDYERDKVQALIDNVIRKNREVWTAEPVDPKDAPPTPPDVQQPRCVICAQGPFRSLAEWAGHKCERPAKPESPPAVTEKVEDEYEEDGLAGPTKPVIHPAGTPPPSRLTPPTPSAPKEQPPADNAHVAPGCEKFKEPAAKPQPVADKFRKAKRAKPGKAKRVSAPAPATPEPPATTTSTQEKTDESTPDSDHARAADAFRKPSSTTPKAE